MSRPYRLALAAVGLLLAGGIGGVWWATRLPDDAVTPAPLPALPDAPAPAPAPSPAAPTLAVLPAQRHEPPPPPLLTDPVPPPPAKGSWEAVTPVPRLSSIGPFGGAIGRAIAGRAEELAACADPDVQSQHAATAPTVGADALGDGGGSTPTVMLLLETGAGTIRIVDATVDERGGADDGLFSCAQHVLRGLTASYPPAKPGKRFRVPYPLVF